MEKIRIKQNRVNEEQIILSTLSRKTILTRQELENFYYEICEILNIPPFDNYKEYVEYHRSMN